MNAKKAQAQAETLGRALGYDDFVAAEKILRQPSPATIRLFPRIMFHPGAMSCGRATEKLVTAARPREYWNTLIVSSTSVLRTSHRIFLCYQSPLQPRGPEVPVPLQTTDPAI